MRTSICYQLCKCKKKTTELHKICIRSKSFIQIFFINAQLKFFPPFGVVSRLRRVKSNAPALHKAQLCF